MRGVRTRECTEVYFRSPPADSNVVFEKRVSSVDVEARPGIFHSTAMEKEKVSELLDESLRAAQKVGKRPPLLEVLSEKAVVQDFRRKVNEKRAFIAQVLQNNPTWPITHVMRYTRSDFQTVKRVSRDLEYCEAPTVFYYNNVKPKREVEELHKSLEKAHSEFRTIGEIKRVHMQFSRKEIAKHMKKLGLRYLMLPRERKKPEYEAPEHSRVRAVISHLAQGLVDPSAEVLYVDEFKLPLFQTPTHAWMRIAERGEQLYNRRDVPDSEKVLTLVAACNRQGFVAAQVYDQELTAEGFVYFLNHLLAPYPQQKKVTVLLDNASWHKAKIVKKSTANRYLFFNVERQYMLNLIESAFSFTRAEFRKRPMFETMEQEARYALEIFFQEKNKKRFEGLFRNHLRMLQKCLNKQPVVQITN